jgi:hypothetical protein
VVKIPLWRKGEVVAYSLVDESDAPLVNQWRWTRTDNGYAYRSASKDGRSVGYMMHRELLGLGSFDGGLEVDHINGNALDNRRANLRAVTKVINLSNRRGMRKGSKQPHINVAVKRGKFHASFCFQRRRINVGWFGTLEEAVAALNAKRAELGLFPYTEKHAA